MVHARGRRRHNRTRQDRARSRPVVGLVVATVLAVVAPAAAQSGGEGVDEAGEPARVTAADLGIEVTAGYDGHLLRSRWVPVEVTVAPDRLVAGTLRVLTEGNTGRQAEVRTVEVAAGAVKVFRFVVPPTFGMTVELELHDERTVRVPVETDTSARFIVGVLGDAVPDGAPPVNAYALQTPATVAAVPAEWLELSDRALDPVTTLVADTTALAALSDGALTNLRTAVAAGLDLVAVVGADGPVELPLPPGWVPATSATTRQVVAPGGQDTAVRVLTPTPEAWTLRPVDLAMDAGEEPVAAAVTAGRGRVAVVGVALGEGPLGRNGLLWGHLASPTGVTQGFEDPRVQRIASIAPQTLQGDDFEIPPLGVLAVFLVVYVLAVGPVNGLVLSRLDRREFAWLTIPAITLVFGAAAWVGAAGSSPSVGLAGRASWWIDGQGGELAVAAIRDPRPGVHTLALPGEGWAVTSATWNVPAVVDRSGRDTAIQLELEAMEVGTAVGWRAHERRAPLAVEVVAGDPPRLRVRNLTTETISELRVHAATSRLAIGDLAPGEEIEKELALGDTLPVRNAFGDDFADLRGRDGRVQAPAAMEALLRWDVLDGAPGLLWVSGTVASELDLGSIAADGGAVAHRGTFIAVGIDPPAPSGAVSPFQVQRQLVVPGFGELWQPGPLTVEGRAEAVLRYRLPRVEPLGMLTSSLERGQLMGGGPGAVQECWVQEVRGGDGDIVASQEVCGDPAAPPSPPCPPDATSCAFDGERFEICRGDDECEIAEVTSPPPAPDRVEGSGGLEVWDVVDRAWVPVGEAFPDGVGDPGRLVTPLGEVLVRVSGELHPFDFSGRGIGIAGSGEVDA